MSQAAGGSGGLEGTAVIVTGGGTGIGRACAEALAADGAAVTICGRTESKLEDAAKRIGAVAGHGGSVRYIVADVTAAGGWALTTCSIPMNSSACCT